MNVTAVGDRRHHILQRAAAAEFVSKLEGEEEVGVFLVVDNKILE